MNIWAISDLHLSHAAPEQRDRYAARWSDHAARIEQEWRSVVRASDLVLLPGDVSMARDHRGVQPDLAWLARLPGTKVMSPGNHDRWFGRVARVRPILRPNQLAVSGDAVATHGVIVCGCEGCPAASGEEGEEAEDAETVAALKTLDKALAAAVGLREAQEPIYVLWHYPPFDRYGSPGPAVARLRAAGVAVCVYGHLHAEDQWSRAVHGVVDGVFYAHVAADALGFRPLRLAELP